MLKAKNQAKQTQVYRARLGLKVIRVVAHTRCTAPVLEGRVRQLVYYILYGKYLIYHKKVLLFLIYHWFYPCHISYTTTR